MTGPLPGRHTPLPGRHTPLPGRHTPLPGRHTPLPGRHTPLPGRHTPLRPIWLCRVDANPWPCGEAKLALLARYDGDRPGLLALLARLSAEATEHLTQLDNGRQIDVTDRFLTWARPPDR